MEFNQFEEGVFGRKEGSSNQGSERRYRWNSFFEMLPLRFQPTHSRRGLAM